MSFFIKKPVCVYGIKVIKSNATDSTAGRSKKTLGRSRWSQKMPSNSFNLCVSSLFNLAQERD